MMEKVKFEIGNNHYGYYVEELNHPHHYLHKDGVVRHGTYNEETHKYDGYYKTEAEAQAAIDGVPTVGYTIFSTIFDAIFGRS